MVAITAPVTTIIAVSFLLFTLFVSLGPPSVSIPGAGSGRIRNFRDRTQKEYGYTLVSMRSLLLLFFLLEFFGGEICLGRYLVSDFQILRAPEATFTMIYLAPDQYLVRDTDTPSPVGELLDAATRQLALEAGDYLIDDFSSYYHDDPDAMRYIRDVLAPSVRNGKILDGRSSVLLVYRQAPEYYRKPELVGLLKAAWVTPRERTFPFQTGKGRRIRWPEITAPGEVSQYPLGSAKVDRLESRELKHLSPKPGTPEDIAALLVYFGTDYGVMGTRVESRWGDRMVDIYSRPRTFFLRCLPFLVKYYRKRAGFALDRELGAGSDPARSAGEEVVMRLEAADWDRDRFLRGTPGKIGLGRLLENATVERVDQLDLLSTLYHQEAANGLPSVDRFLETLRSGDFAPVAYHRECARLVAELVGITPAQQARLRSFLRGTTRFP
jgi:hypothetical protein